MLKLNETDPTSTTHRTRVWSRPGRATSSIPSNDGKSGDGGIEAPETGRPKRGGWLSALLATVVVGGIVLATVSWFVGDDGGVAVESPASKPIPAAYQPARAMGFLTQLCDIGPRPSGSPGMQRQQQLLQSFFTARGADVSMQTFDIRHPETGEAVPMANLIARWGIDRPKRFLLCAHYDTRPFPDQDRINKRGVFVGANDGASGTAALMELSYQFDSLPPDVGVDVVLFDGEEFIFEQGRDDYFLGSIFFAEKYKAEPPAIRYQAGILLDMVADRELKIYYEENSLRYARDVAKSVWRVADQLGVTAFVPRARHRVSDDHLPLNQIANIPTIDIIDFDYPRPGFGAPSYWHTEQDIPANCSGESIAAVVWVVDQWLKQR